MKWAPVVPAFTQQRQQKAVSYFPHSTLEAVLHYVSRGGGVWRGGGGISDCACTVSRGIFTGQFVSWGRIEATRSYDGKAWMWRQCQTVQSHRVFECGDLLCGSARGLDFCVLVSLCWFSSCELPSSPLSFFPFFCVQNPLLPLPSVPDCFAPQSSGVLVSSCCWPLSTDRLNRTDLTWSMTVAPLWCFLSAIKD